MGAAQEFNDDNFESDVLNSGTPVLVDFWAPWCMPCRSIAPMIDELAGEYEGTASIGKVNIDDCPGIAQRYGVASIPTLLVFKDGEITDRFVGPQPKPRLQEALDGSTE
jgi:thioredoxin 1